MSHRIWVACLALLSSGALAQYPGAKKVPNEWKTGFNSITVPEAKPILNFLAGPQFNGRNPDTGDFFAAAGYVSSYLNALGLEPGGDKGSFLQRFSVVYATALPSGTEIRSDDGAVKIPYGTQFSAGSLDDTTMSIKFAFIHASKDADASKLDWSLLKGRWVLMSAESSDNPTVRDQFVKGAKEVGALIWQVPNDRPILSPIPVRTVGVKGIDDPTKFKITAPQIKLIAAQQIAQKCGATKFLAKSTTEASIEVSDVPFTIQVKVNKDEKPACNVVGILRGSDPVLKEEFVVVGSHLDHLGFSDKGIRFGADDNGSGCTANMLVARAMVLNPVKPKRTVIYIFYDHEETGLYGSFYNVNRPEFPADKTVACFNMDMVGRNENRGVEIAENNVNAVYAGIVELNSPDFYQLMVKANQYVNLRIKPDREDRTFRTDTGNYVRKGIPTIKVFTGEHEDYHQVGDTVDKINWEKMTNIAKWVYLGIQEMSAQATRPKFVTKPFVVPAQYILAGHAMLKGTPVFSKKATLTVEVYADPDNKAIFSSVHPVTGQMIPFETIVPKALLVAGKTYRLQFKLDDGGRTLFVNEGSISVPLTGWSKAQDVNLVPLTK